MTSTTKNILNVLFVALVIIGGTKVVNTVAANNVVSYDITTGTVTYGKKVTE